MNGYEFLIFLAVLGAVIWYCWRVTRVSEALDEYGRMLARHYRDDEELLLEIGQYVSNVVLPDLTCRAALKQPDDETSVAGKKLVAAVAARCAAYLSEPEQFQPTPKEQTK
jgi:hypothetical protein